MIFRWNRFFFDEREIIAALFGVFLAVCFFMGWSLAPFRIESLTVLFVFLIMTRLLVSQTQFAGYMNIILAGILFSLFLSPYGLAIYVALAVFLYTRFVR